MDEYTEKNDKSYNDDINISKENNNDIQNTNGMSQNNNDEKTNKDRELNQNQNMIEKSNINKNDKSSHNLIKTKLENSDLIKKSILNKTKFFYKEGLKIPIYNAKQRQKIKDFLKYTHAELDDLDYKMALKYDQRSYFQYYLSLLESNHLIIKIFDKTDYNSRFIKIFLAYFNFVSCYAINALFFNDETMHQIYEDGGDFNLIYQLPQIVYSTIISYIIDNVTNYFAMSQEEIINLKQEKQVKKIVKKAKHTFIVLRLKFIGFFIISFLFMLLFWYYLGCFCAVYKNTQYHLIKDTLLSFAIGNLTPLGTSLIPGLFRIHSLSEYSKGKKLIYDFSKFISKFC